MTNSAVQRRQDQTDEAPEWIARLRAHDVSDLDRVRFVEWFAEEANRAAFDEVLDLWERLQRVVRQEPRPRTSATDDKA
jgi:ferric-dicitrate binding protein FerR (iron transport regulator)